MRKLIKYFRPYTWSVLVLLTLTYIQVQTNLKLPDYTAKIVNEGIINKDNDVIYHAGLWMLLVSLIGAVATIGISYLASKISTGFSRDVRNKVFQKVESFSLIEINKFSTASLITRSTNDIQQIQMVYIMIFRMVLAAPFMAIGSIIKAYRMAPSMSWVIALAVIILMMIIIVLFTIALPKFKKLQELVDKLNLVTRENLTGLRVIRAFNNESIEEKKFDKANLDLTSTGLFVNRLMSVMQPFVMLIFNLTTIAIVWFAAKLIGNGDMQIGDMMAFMQYAIQTIMAFLMVSIIFIMVPRASVSGRRVAEVLETKPVIESPKDPEKIDINTKGIIEFKDVTFSYPGAELPVLTNISFVAYPGQVTAFIGSTGSGKSTLINLIPRLYDVTAGQILIDGTDIRRIDLEDLYRIIGYVPQKGVLFSGTIKSNIAYGLETFNDNEIQKAADISQSSEFIDNYDDKFNHNIAQAGSNVSGGQKQRLSIARALAKKARINIFDDSFSALDYKTDSMLRKALAEVTKDKTVIIVGQRIGTIMNADNIIVLDEGKIVGSGKHHELLINCEIYREIARSQLSEDELENKNLSIDDKKMLSEAK